jgi:hypothetical protein
MQNSTMDTKAPSTNDTVDASVIDWRRLHSATYRCAGSMKDIAEMTKVSCRLTSLAGAHAVLAHPLLRLTWTSQIVAPKQKAAYLASWVEWQVCSRV